MTVLYSHNLNILNPTVIALMEFLLTIYLNQISKQLFLSFYVFIIFKTWHCFLALEDTASYTGLLLAPAEGFGLQAIFGQFLEIVGAQ